MNYELTLKLKEAGFKQFGNRIETPYIPTLSELIEACGDGFERILRIKGKYQTNKPSTRVEYRIDDWYWYSTPEEAVANLWLELNKK